MHGFMLRRGSPFLPGGSIRLRKHRRRERGIGRRACRSGGGAGRGGAAGFHSPAGIAAIGITLYVCDTGNHTLRKIVSTSGVVTTLAGSPGTRGGGRRDRT